VGATLGFMAGLAGTRSEPVRSDPVTDDRGVSAADVLDMLAS
jgi:hypothetical protein